MILYLLIGGLACAQIDSVQLQTDPTIPVETRRWTLSLFVSHPVPSQIRIRAPAFPSALTLDQVRTEVRTMRTGQRVTVFDYLFTAQRAGTSNISPFEITIPGKTFRTEAFSVTILAENARALSAVWEGPRNLTVGTPSELLLRAVNGNPDFSQQSLRIDVPEHALVDLKYPTDSEKKQGIMFRIRVIPLEHLPFNLPAFRIPYPGGILDVPTLNLPVQAAPAPDSQPDLPEEAPPNIPPEAQPFPEVIPSALIHAQKLWESGQIAESLAEIRRLERDSVSRKKIIPVRKEAERRAGLSFNSDEQPRPRILLILISALCGAGAIGGIVLSVRLGRLTLPFIIGLGLLSVSGTMFLMKPPTAIIRSSAAYRVPDTGSTITGYFDEGQPVRILSAYGSWAQIKCFDGRSGWVEENCLIRY
ncbi:hypothetical protein FACS1894172_19620 [Spirochaetia bacterium]|nr:hypothetical protein FACS1894172_19620 [Spirochaetia bacterium]